MYHRRCLLFVVLLMIILVHVLPDRNHCSQQAPRCGRILYKDTGKCGIARASERQTTDMDVSIPKTVFVGEQLHISGLLTSTADHARLSDKAVKLFWENELITTAITGREGYSLGRFEFNIAVDRSPGDHDVTLVFSGDEFFEYSQLKQVVTVESAFPDILVNNKHIFIEPEIPVTNSSVSIRCVVRNIGGADSRCIVSFYQDGTDHECLIEQCSVNVSKKSKGVVSAVWRAVPGDHVIWVSARSVSMKDVDPYNDLAYKEIYVDPIDNGTWSMFGHDVCRSGHTDFSGPVDKTLAWYARDINIGSYTAAKSSPAVYKDKVVIGGDTGKITAFHKFTGQILWEYQTGDNTKGIHSSPIIHDDRVFFGSYDHKVYALDLTTGKKVWSYDTGGWVGSSPAIYDGKLFIGSDVGYKNGQLIALDIKDGGLLWAFNSTGDIHSSPAVDPVLGIVFVGSNDKNIYALDMNGSMDGDRGIRETSLNRSDLVWNFSTGNAIKASPVLDPITHTVYVPSWDGYIYALNGSDGRLIWKKYIGPYLYSSPAIYKDRLIVVGHYLDGAVHALDKYTGDEIWAHDTGGYALASPTIANDTLYLGLKGNDIFALDIDTGGIKWYYDNYANVTSSCAISSEMMFVASDSPEGILYAFGRPTSIISFTSRDVKLLPRYPRSDQPFFLEMSLSNLGTESCRIDVRVLTKPHGAGEEGYDPMGGRELYLDPWQPTVVTFQLFLEEEGMHDISIELREVGALENGFEQDVRFISGRNVSLSLNVSGDTDADGMPDAWERKYGLDIHSNDMSGDPDGDGLTNLGEYWEHSRPDKTDTDGDGLTDWVEIDISSCPRDPDTDDDGIPDGWEYRYAGHPLQYDSAGDDDMDGLTNLEEYLWNSDPLLTDTDTDEMPDAWEVTYTFWDPETEEYVIDPLNTSDSRSDPDNDGFDHDNDSITDKTEMLTNLEEYFYHTDPSRPDSDLNGIPDGRQLFGDDLDGDGMMNGWEELNYLDPFSGADGNWDSDGDGLANIEEWELDLHPTDPDMDDDGVLDGKEIDIGTDPADNDTDNDGIPDGWEIANGLDPLDQADAEEDGDLDQLPNSGEYAAGSDPRSADSDGDGIMDGRDEHPTDFDPRAVLFTSIDHLTKLPSGETVLAVYTLVSVEFNASLSLDREENITQYLFDFGDGGTSGWINASSVIHSYPKTGSYTAELRVKNENGISNTIIEKMNIFVLNRLPLLEVKLGISETMTLSPVRIDLSGVKDLDGTVENISVRWGDGIITYLGPFPLSMINDHSEAPPGELLLVHNYTDDGIYTIRITADDDDGGNNVTTFDIKIINRPPKALVTLPNEILLDQNVTFAAYGSTDDDGKIAKYQWRFEDGRTFKGDTVSLSFKKIGMTTVTLTVRDDDGETSAVTESFFVKPDSTGADGKDERNSLSYLIPLALGSLAILILVARSIFISRKKKDYAIIRIEGKAVLSNASEETVTDVHKVRKKEIKKKVIKRAVLKSVPEESKIEERGEI